MTFVEVLLNILSIIGIVAIGGIVIYFLGGVLLRVLESKNKKDAGQTQNFAEQPVLATEKVHEIQPEQTYEDTISEEKFVLEDDEKIEAIDYNKATEEKKSLNQETEPVVAKDPETNLFNDEKDFDFEDFDFDAFFNEQNQALEAKKDAETTEETAQLLEVKGEEALETATFVEEPADEAASVVTPETKSFAEENFAQTITSAEHVENNNLIETTTLVEVQNTSLEEELRAEIAALKTELFEQKRLYDELKAQTEENQRKWDEEKLNLEQLYAEAEKREEESAAKPQNVLSIEEYESRLAVLRDRLKINETELRLNRKEFIPLRRVRKNLDKDKAKLRRREALVAKQKVLLYGVNNIMEIDQEKAKKLAEDLDLLDGLKVSVRHCEEVMEANKERYPILETANRILVTQNEEIKADILACELAIRKLKAENGEDVDALELSQISMQPAPEKRKRGRPRKVKVDEAEQTSFINQIKTQPNAEVETVKLETINVAEEQQRLENIVSAAQENATVLHTAQTENVIAAQPEVAVIETLTTEETPVSTTTTIVKKEETQIITTTEHKYDFDAEEPSMEDLFAIEQENIFLTENKLFDDDDARK